MDSNRLQLAGVREVTIGTTPGTPRMRKMRFTGEGLVFKPDFVRSNTIRDDRMNLDPIRVGESNGGSIDHEFHYPVDTTMSSEDICSAMMAEWSNTAQRDNDGTADSVITDVATTNEEVTHTTGTAFVAGQLVRFTGFGVSNNNGVFKCTTGGATTSRYVGSGITNEASVAAAARMKVVGFQGASGDITATSTGLGSTALDFTTLGLAVGQWVKIGGTASGDKFATAALNDWARITAIAATALTLDNRPSGWTTDAGTGKTIKVWTGDYIRNGTTKIARSLERGFLSQGTPTYILQKGMGCTTFRFSVGKKAVATYRCEYVGMDGSQGTSAQDASPDAAPAPADYPVMAGSANVGRLAQNGSALGSPNWADSISYSINNNLRMWETVTDDTAVGWGLGECAVMVEMRTYFGDNTLLAQLHAGTAVNAHTVLTKNSQAVIWSAPRLTAVAGNPNAGGKNQDVYLPLQLEASYDSTTACHVQCQRVEYYE